MTPASWLFVAVTVVLLAVLAYYLTLTTRPEISQISPAPNSSHVPGPVEIGAVITSQRSIDSVQFLIDGEPVSPRVDNNGDQTWLVSHEQVFERGEREIVLQVTDSSGRVTEHTWSFESGGDLVPPRLALHVPPTDAALAEGLAGIAVHATTFAEIETVSMRIDGQSIDVVVEPVTEPSSEYTSENGLPVLEWKIASVTELVAGNHILEATVTDVYGASTTENWTIETTASADATARYFPETAEYAVEPFLSFWEENDGATTFGPPVSPTLLLENGKEQQFFRYARLEFDDVEGVQIGLIGRELFGDPEDPPDRPPGDASRLFDPTGHYIHGAIRDYWENNGALSLFGYPISQQFNTPDGYAQFFERALIQVIQENGVEEVERAPLGKLLYEELTTRERTEQVQDDEHQSDE